VASPQLVLVHTEDKQRRAKIARLRAVDSARATARPRRSVSLVHTDGKRRRAIIAKIDRRAAIDVRHFQFWQFWQFGNFGPPPLVLGDILGQATARSRRSARKKLERAKADIS
jgi:hypothetical protein